MRTRLVDDWLDAAYDESDSQVLLKGTGMSGDDLLKSDCETGVDPYDPNMLFVTRVEWSTDGSAFRVVHNGRAETELVGGEIKPDGKRLIFKPEKVFQKRGFIDAGGNPAEPDGYLLQRLTRQEVKYVQQALANNWLNLPGDFRERMK